MGKERYEFKSWAEYNKYLAPKVVVKAKPKAKEVKETK